MATNHIFTAEEIDAAIQVANNLKIRTLIHLADGNVRPILPMEMEQILTAAYNHNLGRIMSDYEKQLKGLELAVQGERDFVKKARAVRLETDWGSEVAKTLDVLIKYLKKRLRRELAVAQAFSELERLLDTKFNMYD